MKTYRVIAGLLCLVWVLVGCGSGPGPEIRQRAEALIEEPEPFPSIDDGYGEQRWIYSIHPRAGTVVSLSEPFHTWDARRFTLDVPPQNVCVHFFLGGLLREGDFWDSFENWEMLVDGQPVPDSAIVEPLSFDVGMGIEDHDGNSLAWGPEDQIFCAKRVVTKPGPHVVDLNVWTSTGETSTFSWAFQVEK